MPEERIQVDFKLPNHGNELSKAEDVLEKIRYKFEKHKDSNSISDKAFIALYEETCKVLAYVGNLSRPAFEVEDELEALYTKRYIHAPELARQLWLDHYESIHHPYNLIKNRCYRLLEELDEFYQALYDKYPPNWKI